jgi:hypothetical protein
MLPLLGDLLVAGDTSLSCSRVKVRPANEVWFNDCYKDKTFVLGVVFTIGFSIIMFSFSGNYYGNGDESSEL